MPFKLISGIILTVFVALVTGFNLGNNTDVWFFHTFEQLPVVGVILGSFIFGVIITIPFCMFADHKSKKSIEEKLLLKIRKQEEKAAKETEKIQSKVKNHKVELKSKSEQKNAPVEKNNQPEKAQASKVESTENQADKSVQEESEKSGADKVTPETDSKKFKKFPLLNK